jgi:CheY-like chemotaxis protein
VVSSLLACRLLLPSEYLCVIERERSRRPHFSNQLNFVEGPNLKRQLCVSISFPAPVNPRAHFQHCPGLIAETLLCQYRGVVRNYDCDLFQEFMTAPDKVLGKRILLADDQQDVRELTKLMLDMDEHVVTEAANGREALDLFAPDRFDLVITDYLMPVMKGDELARSIKRLAPSEPILMITGSAGELGGMQMSVDAVLNKPFAFEDLRQAVAQLLCPIPD